MNVPNISGGFSAEETGFLSAILGRENPEAFVSLEKDIKAIMPGGDHAKLRWHVAEDLSDGESTRQLFDIRALCKSKGYKSAGQFKDAVEAHDISPVLIEEGKLHVPEHLEEHFRDVHLEMHEMDEEGAVQVRRMQPHDYMIEIMSAEHYDRIRNAATLAFENLSKALKAQEEKSEKDEENSLAKRKLSQSGESLHDKVKGKFPDLQKLATEHEIAAKEKLAALNHEEATKEMYAEQDKIKALDKKSERQKEIWDEQDHFKEIGEQDKFGGIIRKHQHSEDTEK